MHPGRQLTLGDHRAGLPQLAEPQLLAQPPPHALRLEGEQRQPLHLRHQLRHLLRRPPRRLLLQDAVHLVLGQLKNTRTRRRRRCRRAAAALRPHGPDARGLGGRADVVTQVGVVHDLAAEESRVRDARAAWRRRQGRLVTRRVGARLQGGKGRRVTGEGQNAKREGWRTKSKRGGGKRHS